MTHGLYSFFKNPLNCSTIGAFGLDAMGITSGASCANIGAALVTRVALPLILQVGVAANSPKTVSLLLKMGVDPNEGVLFSPLTLAAKLDRTNMVKQLIEGGADPDQKDSIGWAPLHHAVSASQTEMVDILIEAGADVKIRGKNDLTPLHGIDNAKVAQKLIDAGADIEAKSNCGYTPLGSACSFSKKEVVLALLGLKKDLFSDCDHLHNMMDRIFPPQRILDQNCEIPTWKIPLVNLSDLPDNQEIFLISKKRYSSTIQTLLIHSIMNSPLFRKAWQFANEKEPLTITEASQEEVNPEILGGKKIYEKDGGAHYNHKYHSIKCSKSAEINQKCSLLIFEVMNAVQRQSFSKIADLAESGELSREEYALLKERVEYNSSKWSETVFCEFTKIPYRNETFADYWNSQNNPLPSYCAHTDNYRLEWDAVYFPKYLAKHPDILNPYK